MSDATQHARGTSTSTVLATPTPTLAQLETERALVDEASRTIHALVLERDALLAALQAARDYLHDLQRDDSITLCMQLDAAIALAGGGNT